MLERSIRFYKGVVTWENELATCAGALRIDQIEAPFGMREAMPGPGAPTVVTPSEESSPPRKAS